MSLVCTRSLSKDWSEGGAEKKDTEQAPSPSTANQNEPREDKHSRVQYNLNLENAAYNVIHTRLESLQVDVSWDIYKYLHTYFILFDTISRISYYVY